MTETRHTISRILAATCCAVALGSGVATAQDSTFIRGPETSAGLYARTCIVGETNTTLFALPLYYSFAATQNLGLDAAVAPAFGFTSSDESALFRASNLRLRFSYNVADKVLLTLGGRIPSGPNRFSAGQTVTQGNLAARQLNFEHGYMYASPDVCAAAASSLAFGDVGPGDLSVGLGVSYLFKGPFHPVENLEEPFNPGDEINGSVAAEYSFIALDRRIIIAADGGYTYFFEDRYPGVDTIQAGGKVNWAVAAETEAAPKVPVRVWAANYLKGIQRDRYGETGKRSFDLFVSASAGLPVLEKYAPYVRAEGRFFSGGVSPEAGRARIGAVLFGGNTRLAERFFAHLETGIDLGAMGGQFLFGAVLNGSVDIRM